MKTSDMLVNPYLPPAEREAKFNSLSLANRRKAGVQDALYQIDIKKVQVSKSGYMTLNKLDDLDWCETPSFQKMLDNPGEHKCSACAAGTLWIGFVHIMDKTDFSAVTFVDIAKKLKGLFSVKQLRMIEMVFENSCDHHGGVLNLEEEALCFTFHYDVMAGTGLIESAEPVFRAICTNILASKTGKFNPARSPIKGV